MIFDGKLSDIGLCGEGKAEALHLGEHLATCEECRKALDDFQAALPLINLLTQGKKLSALLAEKLAELGKEK